MNAPSEIRRDLFLNFCKFNEAIDRIGNFVNNLERLIAMRTVDPELWSEHVKKPSIGRRFGQAPDRSWEGVVRGGFGDAMREYRRHCSIRSLVDLPDSKPFRVCYVLATCAVLAWGLMLVVYVRLEHGRRPPLQVHQLPRAPRLRLPFPAVAVCSNCVISRSALDQYAAYLASKSNSAMELDAIRESLKNFGAIVTMIGQDQDVQFMRFLYSIEPDFNVTELMYQLSPNCSKILKRCSWRGNNVECDRLFAKRATPLGFCCVFNSRYHPEDEDNKPKMLNLVGQNFGLGAVVTENMEDFAVVRRPISGFDVLLFEGSEYPLLEGGAVRMYPVKYNGSAYFALSARVQLASPSLAQYSEDSRGCHLSADGGGGRRGAHSSYSWCLTECRRHAVAALCRCLPFTLLPAAADVCTPQHLHCLTKHRTKLTFYYPPAAKLTYYYPGAAAAAAARGGLAEEAQDSQSCACVPDCARTAHAAAVYHAVYHYPDKIFKNLFFTGVTVVNTTVLRFYYETVNPKIYTVEVSTRWYEAFATLGCQTRFLLSFSWVAVVELIYHATIRWAYHCLRRSGVLVTIRKKIRRRRHLDKDVSV